MESIAGRTSSPSLRRYGEGCSRLLPPDGYIADASSFLGEVVWRYVNRIAVGSAMAGTRCESGIKTGLLLGEDQASNLFRSPCEPR
jgi:hypothetical protein